jgi:hypothetical protein
VPEDEELQTLLISEFHDFEYAGHFGMSWTRVAVGRMFQVEVSSRGRHQDCLYLCSVLENKARRHKPYDCYSRYLFRRSLGIR